MLLIHNYNAFKKFQNKYIIDRINLQNNLLFITLIIHNF